MKQQLTLENAEQLLEAPVTTKGFVPRAKEECSVYYEVEGNEISFELRGSELTHTRQFTFF